MRAPPSLSRSPATCAFDIVEVRVFVRTVLQRFSWRTIGISLAITGALDLWMIFDEAFSKAAPKISKADAYFSGAVINLLLAASLLVTTLCADEMVARGAKRYRAYGCAVIVGAAVGAVAQWLVHRWFHLRTSVDVADVPAALAAMQPAAVFFENLIWGSAIVFLYATGRMALLASARLHSAQTKRARVRRRTVESRLQVLQARVEPQFLFDTLAAVRDLYDQDPLKGGTMLGELIDYLHAALPSWRDSTSTLGQELKLAAALLNIMNMRLCSSIAFESDVQPADHAYDASMPTMILLPLFHHLAIHRTIVSTDARSIRLSAHRTDEGLHLELSSTGMNLDAQQSLQVLTETQARLRSLYGEKAELQYEPPGGHDFRVVMEIPHEPSDSGHR